MPKSFYDKIDNYKDTVFAIIGFANLFRFDDNSKEMKSEVKIGQGRTFVTSSENKKSPNTSVTPDLCVQLDEERGIVAELKISFPKEQGHWVDDFNQLLKYDDDMTNWWNTDGRLLKHSIVLLLHQSRTAKVAEWYVEHCDTGEINFNRPFSIVEFNRSSQSKEFFFFRKYLGKVDAPEQVIGRLKDGVLVPMEKLMLHYEKHKIYDSKPPMPYLLYLIWENVILRKVSDDIQLARVSRRGKIDISTSVDEITDELHENFSFKSLNYSNDKHQPKMPLRQWVEDAVKALVKFTYAEWHPFDNNECTIYFRKIDKVFEEFIRLCMEHGIDVHDIEGVPKQEELFE